jgi:hypothetical protein
VSARVDGREARVAGTTRAGATIREKGRNLFSGDDPEKTFLRLFGGRYGLQGRRILVAMVGCFESLAGDGRLFGRRG